MADFQLGSTVDIYTAGDTMRYDQVIEGRFISRPNRFIANVYVQGSMMRAHVKNTGRLRELLVKDATVYLQKHDNTNRSTELSLIGVRKGNQTVNIDSHAPNKVMREWLSGESKNRTPNPLISQDEKIVSIKPEFTYGDSRIDFLVETVKKKILMEVKGVTLEENGIALFPDAPTERGVRHILELCRSLDDGYFPVIAFVIQMTGIRHFSPNAKTHKEFADALIYAHRHGVKIIALDCDVGCDSIMIKNQIGVVL
jgi:sugar fermentation stimulation protein A